MLFVKHQEGVVVGLTKVERCMRPITMQLQSTPSTPPVPEIDPNIPSPAPVEPSGVASVDKEETMGEEEGEGDESEFDL